MIQRLRTVDINAQLPKVIEAKSFEIVTLDQIQMQAGTDSDGKKITPSYKSAPYARKKLALNPQPGYGVPDLFLSGALYKGMGVTLSGPKYTILSNVSYFSKLEEYYQKNGSTVFKLSQKSKNQFAQEQVYPAIRKYIADTAQVR